jgi:membrane-associated protease RseP (regulator of RpoE activity)
MILTVSIVLLIFASVAVHELGHAVAMRRLGVRVHTISLLGFPGLGTIPLPIRHPLFSNTRWVLHPLVLGAYVEPDKEQMERLSVREKMIIAGAGPLANICFSMIALGVALGMCFCSAVFDGPGVADVKEIVILFVVSNAVMFGSGFLAWGLWKQRALVTNYLLLPVGFFPPWSLKLPADENRITVRLDH